MECQRDRYVYRTGGWWNDNYRTETLEPLVKSSFAFAVAFDRNASRLAGMGRVISDGVSDGYIQDLFVLPEYRLSGIGGRIVKALLEKCKVNGLEWVGLIAEPGSENFYRDLGFKVMQGHLPMLYKGGT